MGLTRDEQKKIQEEEKIRIKTRNEQEARNLGVGLLIFVIIGLLIYLTNASPNDDKGSQNSSIIKDLLPAVQTFISSHPEYGTVIAITNVPDWAQGKRQTVTMRDHTGLKDYLFYEQNNEIVSVYLITEDRGRVPVYNR